MMIRLLPLILFFPSFVQSALAQSEPKPPSQIESKEKLEKTNNLKVTIKVLPGLIKFETTQFDVPAGTPVKLTFSNGCVLPHNLIIIKPEAEPALIAAVNAMGLEGVEKNYVPEVGGIIAATRLLQPATQEVLSFKAPEKEGDYPYLCTFPGHWFTLRGVMRVRGKGSKLEESVKSAEKAKQVEDALARSGMTHKPLGTPEKPFLMRTFAPDPGLDPAVFAHHGVGKDAVKYDPTTRKDLTEKVTDPNTGLSKEVPIVIKSLKGVAGAIAVNHGADFSYVWDSTECRLLYVWRNGFLNMDPYWGKEPGSSRPKVYLPAIMGHIVYKASGRMPLAESNDAAPIFLGYQMEKGVPVFRYKIGATIFREKVLSSTAGEFEVRVTPENTAKQIKWQIPPLDAEVTKITDEKNGGLIVVIRDRPEPPQPEWKSGEEKKKR